MKSVVVTNKTELEQAFKSDVDEIIIENESLETQLRAVGVIRKAGPIAIAALVAAIPFILFTGGTSVPIAMAGVMGASGAVVSTSIIGLVVAIGGIVVISVFTDWEEVSILGVFTLKRKCK
jgi:hypothetical protein